MVIKLEVMEKANEIKKLLESQGLSHISKKIETNDYIELSFYVTLNIWWAYHPEKTFDAYKYIQLWK
tara:strand:+ start:1205 stop:1405 length:201 start_codon:yes stop_codon:yes gene_type:complete